MAPPRSTNPNPKGTTMSQAIQDASTVNGWTKSSYSGSQGNCVEFAALPDGNVAVRNSKDPQGPALVFNRAEIGAMLAGAQDGEFAAFA